MNEKILTKPIPQLLKDIALPATIGIIFNTFYNVVDTFYAGMISTNAVAGLSISFFLYFMVIGLGFGFSSALTALIGYALGKQKKQLASIYAHKGVVFIALLGFILGLLGFIFSSKLLILAGAKEEFLNYAKDYIDIILLFSTFFLLNSAFNAILVAVGDTRSYAKMLIVGFFANCLLNPLFIYGIYGYGAMGIAGIAFSTALIQIIGSFYLGYKAIKSSLIYSKNLYMYMPNFKIYKNFLSQGLPPSLNILTMSLGSVVLMFFVSTYGTQAVAGYGIAFRVEQIMLLPALGINSAVLSIVSNNFGAKKFQRVKQCIKISLIYGAVLSIVAIILTFSIAKWFVSLFDSNEMVIKYALEYLHVEVFNFFGYIALFICVSTLQGIKRPKAIFYVGVYRQILAIVPIFYFFVFYLKAPYMYMWFALVFIIYSAMIFMLFHTNKALKNI